MLYPLYMGVSANIEILSSSVKVKNDIEKTKAADCVSCQNLDFPAIKIQYNRGNQVKSKDQYRDLISVFKAEK